MFDRHDSRQHNYFHITFSRSKQKVFKIMLGPFFFITHVEFSSNFEEFLHCCLLLLLLFIVSIASVEHVTFSPVLAFN